MKRKERQRDVERVCLLGISFLMANHQMHIYSDYLLIKFHREICSISRKHRNECSDLTKAMIV